jgi:hypothetical protein
MRTAPVLDCKRELDGRIALDPLTAFENPRPARGSLNVVDVQPSGNAYENGVRERRSLTNEVRVHPPNVIAPKMRELQFVLRTKFGRGGDCAALDNCANRI